MFARTDNHLINKRLPTTMNLRNTTLATVLLFSTLFHAQDSTIVSINQKVEPKISYLDSIKQSFVKHEVASCVDERWMSELSNQDLFNEMIADIQNVNPENNVDYDLSTDLLKERLKILDSKSAFFKDCL